MSLIIKRFNVTKQQHDEMLKAIPIGRLGSPADVAADVLFLAGENSGFVNGHQLVVDGGETITN